MAAERRDVWASGDAYEPYVGRWSRLVARQFVAWLGVPPNKDWLDVGSGTGALCEVILAGAAPSQVTGIDPSDGFVSFGLVINFITDQPKAVSEMKRVTRPLGVIGAYVWDYAGEMQMMRHFWDAAVAMDPSAASLDEGRRFPVCHPEPLADLFRKAGVGDVETRSIDVPTIFRDFDDYWTPFLGGQAPAPGYCMSLSEDRRVALRDRIRANLPINADGTIRLIARAWAVRGTVH